MRNWLHNLALRAFEIVDRRSENRITEFGMLAQAFEFAKINGIQGDYFEFGVWRAKTFGYAKTMASRYPGTGITFRAFDSFEGLPPVSQDEYEMWSAGQFACSRAEFEKTLKRKGFAKHEYEIVEGFYQDSLKPELIADLLSSGVRASVIYIDCDLYESTKPVLDFVKHFIQDGTILCFDDFFNYRGLPDRGEQKAFVEFQALEKNLNFVPYMPFSPLGMSFICHRLPRQAGAQRSDDG